MKQLALWLPLFLALFFAEGCSVYLAASQPPKIDVDAFGAGGASRDAVVAKLGAPTSSVKHENGTRTDVYEFYEGSATGWKVGRATFNLIADIFTLGLWELIASPTEMAIRGDKVSARAEFDKRDLLSEFQILGNGQPGTKEKPHPEGAKQPARIQMGPEG